MCPLIVFDSVNGVFVNAFVNVAFSGVTPMVAVAFSAGMQSGDDRTGMQSGDSFRGED